MELCMKESLEMGLNMVMVHIHGQTNQSIKDFGKIINLKELEITSGVTDASITAIGYRI